VIKVCNVRGLILKLKVDWQLSVPCYGPVEICMKLFCLSNSCNARIYFKKIHA
jgi:hypothetical protein